jgi:cysteine desulfurase / selenocysteine lyase
VVTPEDFSRRAGIVSFFRQGVDPRPVAASLERERKILIAARRGFLRASPHFYNDESEIGRLLEALPEQ